MIVAEVPGRGDDTVLLYGHLDKQPPMEPWAEGLGPWTPTMRDGRLYGRGASDDGYAAFAATTAIAALAQQAIPHARLLLVIEAAEESGSPDLAHHIEHLKDRLGSPSLVVCLDSGCGDYERLWSTTSLRGLVSGTLRVDVLTEGVHSGDASGVVASSFRIMRSLLSRIEDERTGKILPPEMHAPVPPQRLEQAARRGGGPGRRRLLEDALRSGLGTDRARSRRADPQPHLAADARGHRRRGLSSARERGERAQADDRAEAVAPPAAHRGRGEGRRRVSRRILEADPPYGARVSFVADKAGGGWDAPALAPWLAESTDRASSEHFGKPACYFGEGGSIPFMGMLGERFPEGAVPGHGRARPALERARTERVPGDQDREEPDRVRGPGARGPRAAVRPAPRARAALGRSRGAGAVRTRSRSA